jgi:hypothetical protein
MSDKPYMDSDEIEEMPGESGSEILEMFERIQQRLNFLEKKLDQLLSRNEGERSFDRARPAPKPFRKPYEKSYEKPYERSSPRFDRPPRRDRNEGEDRDRGDRGDRGYREKESSREHYSDRRGGKPGKKPGGKPRSGFGKKPFYSRYE